MKWYKILDILKQDNTPEDIPSNKKKIGYSQKDILEKLGESVQKKAVKNTEEAPAPKTKKPEL